MSDTAVRRMHPGTILLEVLRAAPSTLLAIPALIGVGSRMGMPVALAMLAAGAVVLVGFKWLAWRSFTYRLAQGELVIERGVLHRQRRSIPLDRIQDVAIEQKPLARLAGLAVVRVETGGGEADDAVFDSVTLAEAHRLREALRRGAVGETAGEGAPPPLFAMPSRRVVLFGLFNFSLFWVAAGFGALQSLDQIADIDWRAWLGIAGRTLRSHINPVTIASLILAALVLGAGAGIVRTLLREYGFRLDDLGNRLRRTRGLLTRSEVVVAKQRIQLAMIHRAPLRRLFGWEALAVQTLGGSDDAGGRQMLVPFGRSDDVARTVAATGLAPFEREALAPVASGHVIRGLIRRCVPLVVVFGGAGFVFAPLWLGLLLLAPSLFVSRLQRRHHRYAVLPESIQITRGVLSQRDWIVPYRAVQVVVVRETWLQRLLGVATVVLDTPGASRPWPEIVDVAARDAAAVALAVAARD